MDWQSNEFDNNLDWESKELWNNMNMHERKHAVYAVLTRIAYSCKIIDHEYDNKISYYAFMDDIINRCIEGPNLYQAFLLK